MIIKVLMDNTALGPRYRRAHGLSLYVQTPRHRLLFDAGPDEGFIANARTLAVDLAGVDTVVCSHGHWDHGGGLPAMLRENKTAPVYLRREALDGHRALRTDGSLEDIGISPALGTDPHVRLLDADLRLDEELLLFSGIRDRMFFSFSNRTLLTQREGALVRDDFIHEQSLLIRADGLRVLLAGCAHCGIVNIVARAAALEGAMPDVVIGGFHLMNPSSGDGEDPAMIQALSQALLNTGARYYTCHCTGQAAYAQLRQGMGERINLLSAGTVLALGQPL